MVVFVFELETELPKFIPKLTVDVLPKPTPITSTPTAVAMEVSISISTSRFNACEEDAEVELVNDPAPPSKDLFSTKLASFARLSAYTRISFQRSMSFSFVESTTERLFNSGKSVFSMYVREYWNVVANPLGKNKMSRLTE